MKKIMKTTILLFTVTLVANAVNAQVASERPAPTAAQVNAIRAEQAKSAAKAPEVATASQKPASAIPARAEEKAPEATAPKNASDSPATQAPAVKPAQISNQGEAKPASDHTSPASAKPVVQEKPVEKSK